MEAQNLFAFDSGRISPATPVLVLLASTNAHALCKYPLGVDVNTQAVGRHRESSSNNYTALSTTRKSFRAKKWPVIRVNHRPFLPNAVRCYATTKVFGSIQS